MKFGGTSVDGSEGLRRILPLIRSAAYYHPVLIVVSAFRGVTDALLSIANAASNGVSWETTWQHVVERHRHAAEELGLAPCSEIERYAQELYDLATGIALLGECTPRMRDAIAAYGELFSSQLLAQLLALTDSVVWHDARTSLHTDARFTNARINWERTYAATRTTVLPLFERYRIVVTQGFIASTTNGITTTLGRGGSDYSASLFGAALGADCVEIWTDVSGVYTADPRVIPEARSLPAVTINEVRTLSAYGAKVLHPLTIEPAIKHGIPVRVRNTFEPTHPGTTIVSTLDVPTEGIRALTLIDVYRSNHPYEGSELVASVQLKGESYFFMHHRTSERDQPVTLICCIGEGIHRSNRALEQIGGASTSTGITPTLVAAGSNVLLIEVNRSESERFFRALHNAMCHDSVEVFL